MIKPLAWSQMKNGNWNAKVGRITLFTVAFAADRGLFVSPKLPGLKTQNVGSEKEGKAVAGKLYREFMAAIIQP